MRRHQFSQLGKRTGNVLLAPAFTWIREYFTDHLSIAICGESRNRSIWRRIAGIRLIVTIAIFCAPKWSGRKLLNELELMDRSYFSHLKVIKYLFLPWDRNSSSSLSFSEKSDKSASDIESWLVDMMDPFWLLLNAFVWFVVAADVDGDKFDPFESTGVLADEAVEQRSLLVSSFSFQSICAPAITFEYALF